MNDIIQAPTTIGDDNLVAIAEAAERRVEAINRIKKAALAVTNGQDWTDQSGKPYLQVSGAEKVARLFGISWRIDQPMLEVDDDRHFSYTYKGYFSMGSAEIEVIGTRSSKDPFFSRGGTIPPTEIDRNDVKKAALTNCIGNGITRFLGIRNLSWDDLKGSSINQGNVTKVEYKQAEMSDEAKDQKSEIQKMILEMTDNDQEAAKDVLAQITEFTGKDGRQVPGKRSVSQLSEKMTPVAYKKVKSHYEKWKGANPNGNTSGADSTNAPA